MSRLLCCLRARQHDMGAALSHQQEGDDGAGGVPVSAPTMADVIRERKKKAGGAGLGTLRRRIANVARRPRDNRPDRGCGDARYVRQAVGGWRVGEVWALGEELAAGAALRDLATRADLAREPAPALAQQLPRVLRRGWWCDVTLCGAGWSLGAHRAILCARSDYFRDLLNRAPGARRVSLEGAAAGAAREAVRAALALVYGAPSPCLCRKHDGHDNPEGDLDIISGDNGNATCVCGRCGRGEARRLAAALGLSRDPLHTSMRYLLDSGEAADARLVFVAEGGGAAYGFSAATELPCHRVLLAARSRYFRSVLSRSSAICVDEAVLPRRFARALLHAAYTDQVDLSLIGRNSSSPSSTNNASSASAWGGVGRNSSRQPANNMLEDAFQLYEIARFLEMPIVVQGCEDAIVETLSAETLSAVLRWSQAAHASQWVHRQAMRYLLDEFTSIMSSPWAASLPRGALTSALASPFLQAGEPAVLRAVLKWGSAGGGGGGGGESLATLLTHVRLEHLPPNHDLIQQLVRRGLISGAAEQAGTAAAWLGRGTFRPIRYYLPYLDEIKALLQDLVLPEAEVCRARRARYMHRIPDTLYMVAAARGSGAGSGAGGSGAGVGGAACLPPDVISALRARARELRAQPPAPAALQHHHDEARRQICLRAVRERNLPDACADILMAEPEPAESNDEDWESRSNPRDDAEQPWSEDCCEHRTLNGSGSLRCASTGSLRSAPALHIPIDNSRPGTCRREQTTRNDGAHHSWGGSCGGARLSAAVPDVAMAPNANTHLLTPRDYFRHPPPWEYGGVVLQLDLGDGATHAPRPGSRAHRNTAHAPRHTDYAQAMSCVRARSDDDELRAAIELSVMRAYSFGVSGSPRASTLPHHERARPGIAHSSRPPEPPAPTHPPMGRVASSPCPSSSPRAHTHYAREYRLDPPYGGSASTSRGHSPNNYA